MFSQSFKIRSARFATKFLTIYGLIWLFVNSFSNLVATIPEAYKGWAYGAFLGLSVLVTFICSRKKKKINVDVNGVSISIFVGDLFKEAGMRVIPVNEFFDRCIGKPVSNNSLHGKFILSILDGKSDLFDQRISAALVGKFSEYVAEKQPPNSVIQLGQQLLSMTSKGRATF